MKWNKTCEKLPEQGKKILCFDNGDVWIAQRFDKYWLEIPFTDSKYAKQKIPDMWSEINFPDPYKGYLLFKNKECGELLNVDEFKKKHPYQYKEFIETYVKKMVKK